MGKEIVVACDIIVAHDHVIVEQIHVEALQTMGVPRLIPCRAKRAVDQSQGFYTVSAEHVEVFHDKLTGHRPAQHGCAANVKVVQQLFDVRAVPLDGVAMQSLGGTALTPGVEGDDAVFL